MAGCLILLAARGAATLRLLLTASMEAANCAPNNVLQGYCGATSAALAATRRSHPLQALPLIRQLKKWLRKKQAIHSNWLNDSTQIIHFHLNLSTAASTRFQWQNTKQSKVFSCKLDIFEKTISMYFYLWLYQWHRAPTHKQACSRNQQLLQHILQQSSCNM